MLSAFLALVLALFAVGGVLGVYEYQLYTPEQKARAPLLSNLYLGAMILTAAVGIGGIAWLLSGGAFSWAWISFVAVVAAIPALVQYGMHRRMGVETGPLVGRIAERLS